MANDEAGELAAALPGYEIGGELGRGAFGVVLAGRHRQLGRPVAIKQLPRAFGEHPEVRHRFSAEAKTLASLDHPHIVPIFDYVEQGGLCVLVMELLPGGTVRQRQASGLSGQAACAIAVAACSALDYAHQRGVLHRDVKPDNLLFTSAGLLKVTDFGIAKVVGDVAVTRIGETPGTPMYMAPEQCLDQPLSPATDVYATGVMLYELLAGHHPFEGSGDQVSTMYRQIHEDARPLRMVSRSVPDALAPVVMRALAKDPAARYHSARAFGGALAMAAAESWGEAWPAGEALRIMSVGPIEEATGWAITTGPVATGITSEDRPTDARSTILLARAGGTSAIGGLSASPPAHSPELPPTVLRAGPGAPPRRADGPRPAPAQPGPPWAPGTPHLTQALPCPPAAETWAQFPPADEQSAPPPATGGGGPSSPPRPPNRRRPLLVALAAAVVAIVAVAGVLALTRRPSPRAGDGTTVAPPPGNPAQEAADLNRLIQESAGARVRIVSTVASIQSCSADLAAAAAVLAAAVITRQQVVTNLASMSVDALPHGAAMRDAMTNGLNDSVEADHDYQAWLEGITATGGCSGQAPHDANWQAAQTASTAATRAKQTFANLWNPVATTYGLAKISSATI